MAGRPGCLPIPTTSRSHRALGLLAVAGHARDLLTLSPPASSIAISSSPLLDVAFLGPASVMVVVVARTASPSPTDSAVPPYSHRTPKLQAFPLPDIGTVSSTVILSVTGCHCTVKVHHLSRYGRSVEKKWHWLQQACNASRP